MTLRNFTKSAGFAKRLYRYLIISLLSKGREGGFYGHSLKTNDVFVLWQQTRCSRVLDYLQEQVSLVLL